MCQNVFFFVILLYVEMFLARDVIYMYTSRAYAMMPVRLSEMELHWHIIANLGFKF